jgi:hypothetical protein
VKGLAREHIAELERKMAEMAQMKATLERIASDCHGDQRADCPILSRLAGDAAAPTAPAPAPVAPKRSAGKASVAARSQRMPQVPAPHAGLSAWMQGLATMRA